MRDYTIVRKIVLVVCAAAIAGCSDSGDSGTGTVSISLMDRPVDGVTDLWVTISEIRVKPQGDGPAFALPMTETPLTVNLLAHDDRTAAVLVSEAVVEAGDYNWVEFTVDDSDVSYSNGMTTDGRMLPLEVDVPSGRIRLVSGFTVGDNQAVRFLFDWNVRKGLTWAVGRDVLILKPAFRVLRADEYGSINGTISMESGMSGPGCEIVNEIAPEKVVYIFEGDIGLDQAAADGVEPLTTVDGEENMDGNFDYRAVVMPGTYTLGFACEDPSDSGNTVGKDGYLPPVSGDPPVPVNPVVVDAATPVEDIDF